MKGNFKITVEVMNDCDSFPITETISLNVDNTPEHIDTMVDYFKRILLMMGYHSNTVKDAFYNEEE